MKIEQLTAVLDSNGFKDGFNALLADSSNTPLVRKVRTHAPGMEVFVRIRKENGGHVALIFFGGECESCATGEGRYAPTGAILDVSVADMGLALILKDAEHYYVLNLDKAISLPR